MNDNQTTRIAHLRKFANAPIKLRGVALSPLLDHFVRSGSQTMGVSRSEFLRRVVINELMQWQKNGVYKIPAEFLASSETPVRGASPSVHVARRYLDS